MIFGINTTRVISQLSQISLACIPNWKYHSWYLCQISLQIMLLPILIIIVITITTIILYEKFLQFNWLRTVVFQLILKYLHVKITNLLQVVV